MAIIINGKVYRNLQEQVEENTEDIEILQENMATKDYVDNSISGLYGDFYTREQSDERYPTETHMNYLLGYKQDTLVSGTNIKTVNNQSLLGEGNITISGGSSDTAKEVQDTAAGQIGEVKLVDEDDYANLLLGVKGENEAAYNNYVIVSGDGSVSLKATDQFEFGVQGNKGSFFAAKENDIEITPDTGYDVNFKVGGIGNVYITKTGQGTLVKKRVAIVDDIPTETSDLINDSGYITGINSTDVTTALGYTPGTSNFSGSYTDLTDKPDLSVYAESSNLATVATTGSYSDLTNKPDLSIYAQSANLAAVATTGAYSDLTGTPTIPDAVSGTNNGVDWTSITIGNNTYDIPSATTGSHLFRHNIQLSGITSTSMGYVVCFDIYNNDSTTYTSLAQVLNALNDGSTGFTGDRITCNGLITLNASTQYRPVYIRKDASDSSWLDAVYFYYSSSALTFSYIAIASSQTSFSITDTIAKIY